MSGWPTAAARPRAGQIGVGARGRDLRGHRGALADAALRLADAALGAAARLLGQRHLRDGLRLGGPGGVGGDLGIVELLLRDGVGLPERPRALEVRLRLLQLRVGAGQGGARGGQLGGGALHAGGRPGERGARRDQAALRRRLDDLHLRLGAGRLGLRGGQLGLGLLHAGVIVAGIDLDEEVAALDLLVLLDVHAGDGTRHAGGDRDHVGGDLRVVGVLATGGHQVVAADDGHHDDGDDGQNGERPPLAPGRGLGDGCHHRRSGGRGGRGRVERVGSLG
jgi:hypothetical protein